MKPYVYTFLALVVFTLYQCQSHRKLTDKTVVKQQEIDFSSSPVVSADQSVSKMKLEEGFEIKLVASEPLISTPVAMSFDAMGRMWVVEMNGYMPDSLGHGEDKPNGKVVILEDRNGDGVADERKVFLDSLVMPRSICLIENGILVAALGYKL